MQQGSSDQELQVAVSKLAGQVEELTAMVAQLAAEPGGSAGSTTAINGGVVDGGAALPVVSTKAKGESKPLVRYGQTAAVCDGGYADYFALLSRSCVVRRLSNSPVGGWPGMA